MAKLIEETTFIGNALVVHEMGIILTGASASGKSELALELINRGHHFIADDMVLLLKDNSKLTIKPVKLNFYPMHIRGLGFIDIATLYPNQVTSNYVLSLIIELKPDVELLKIDALNPTITHENLLGCLIPKIQLANNNRYGLTTLIEVIVKQFKLKKTYLGEVNAINFD
jgi:HPr kinase/phosphorylase